MIYINTSRFNIFIIQNDAMLLLLHENRVVAIVFQLTMGLGGSKQSNAQIANWII